jgi:DNA-binding response OmpR family regulator
MAHKTVLVVEDDSNVATLLQAVLAMVPGCRPIVVGTDAQALQVVDAQHVDLVLLNAQLPGPGGCSLYDRLRSRPETAGIPFLFMSTERHDPELDRRGITNVLIMPFALKDVLERVEAFLQMTGDTLPLIPGAVETVNPPAAMSERLAALNQEAFDAMDYETAYHLLSAALHHALFHEADLLLHAVAVRARAQVKGLDGHARAPGFSSPDLRLRILRGKYEALADLARACAPLVRSGLPRTTEGRVLS